MHSQICFSNSYGHTHSSICVSQCFKYITQIEYSTNGEAALRHSCGSQRPHRYGITFRFVHIGIQSSMIDDIDAYVLSNKYTWLCWILRVLHTRLSGLYSVISFNMCGQSQQRNHITFCLSARVRWNSRCNKYIYFHGPLPYQLNDPIRINITSIIYAQWLPECIFTENRRKSFGILKIQGHSGWAMQAIPDNIHNASLTGNQHNKDYWTRQVNILIP